MGRLSFEILLRVARRGGPHARPQSQRDSRWARTDVGSRRDRTRNALLRSGLLTAVLALHAQAVVVASDSYCAQLDVQGVEGKSVTITAGVGNEIRTMDGVVLAIEPGTIILRPGKVSDEPQPLYDHGRIVEPDRTRVYVNCEQIFSVVVNK